MANGTIPRGSPEYSPDMAVITGQELVLAIQEETTASVVKIGTLGDAQLG